MTSHRTFDGVWAECPSPEECALPFHVALNVAEAEAVPLTALLPLFEAVDPPQHVLDDGMKSWGDGDNLSHRDYGLPARIYPNGAMEWWRHGARHREHDLPAITYASGARQWWVNNVMARPSDGPTEVASDGTQRWFCGAYGQVKHRTDGPAVIYPDGRVEFWVEGRQVESL